jgi:broad specificity phosphatase PhoE
MSALRHARWRRRFGCFDEGGAMSGVPFALLRHAPTAWNAAGRLQGLTDIGLSPEGEALARRWRLPAPADGWKRMCSPLQRARRTAELLQPSVAVTVDIALREMSFGLWEGRTLTELRAAGGAVFAAAEAAGLDFQPPGGESPRATMIRVGHWAAGLARTGEPAVAVSHKAAIRALLALATGWDMQGRPPHKLDWHSVHFFVAHDDGGVAIERLNVPLEAAP